jgi:hypothetical protein
MNHLAPFVLLPVTPGTCPECATVHEPEEPSRKTKAKTPEPGRSSPATSKFTSPDGRPFAMR